MTGDLFHSDGSRKYLTQDERQAFLTAATQFPHTVRSFCAVLTYTGCRLGEALALTADRVDLSTGRLTFETRHLSDRPGPAGRRDHVRFRP